MFSQDEMVRRLLSLHFPCLAIDRLEREDPRRRLCPFAVTQEEKGHFYIAGVNIPAARAGITPGTRLADARAALPNLQTVPDDPAANTQVIQYLIRWCERYSPLVASDGFGGVVLDITGCAHLFGGEAALLEDVQSRIRRTEYRVRGAIADSPGAAWALARYGKQTIVTGADTPAVLDPLPVEALRLPEEIVFELRRVGLTTVAALRKMSRDSLGTRYGPGILRRLDQAFGRAEEPIAPYRFPVPHSAGRMLAEPIGTTGAVEHVLLDLLKEVCSRLTKGQLGARQMDLDCYRVDGTVVRRSIRTSRPARSITHWMRLFAEKLETLDAGFGIEKMVLSAPVIDSAGPVQFQLPHFDVTPDTENSLDELVDTLALRLGFEQVCRLRVRESLLPEYALEFTPVTAPVVPDAKWPSYRIRPVRLITPPLPIKTPALLPGEAPAQFQIGRQLHRVVRAEGPERLASEWWRDEPLRWGTRDYYRIEDEKGSRFWIFRDASQASWFLHGHLP